MEGTISIDNISLDLSEKNLLSSIQEESIISDLFCELFSEKSLSAERILSLEDNKRNALFKIIDNQLDLWDISPNNEHEFISELPENERRLLEACQVAFGSKTSLVETDSLKLNSHRITCFSKFISNL